MPVRMTGGCCCWFGAGWVAGGGGDGAPCWPAGCWELAELKPWTMPGEPTPATVPRIARPRATVMARAEVLITFRLRPRAGGFEDARAAEPNDNIGSQP